jgi:disulfide bond formation protein DsbB
MLSDPYYFSKFIGTLVLISQLAGVVTFIALLFFRKRMKGYFDFLAKYSTVLALIVAIVATASSLTFSDIFNMEPCKLCIYQRIVIFPQVIILAVALWKKHHSIITDYAIALACIAIPISIFHYVLQMTDAPAVHSLAPCDVTGQAPSCSSYYVVMYNYITIPMMALTTSVLILILMVNKKIFRK